MSCHLHQNSIGLKEKYLLLIHYSRFQNYGDIFFSFVVNGEEKKLSIALSIVF
jgi:hypothetical protein